MPKINVAIVEDDLAISQMYRMKFESLGYGVEIAEDGVQGLELVKQIQPDVVLLDMMMPNMDGADMLERMRAESWGKDIPVVILTNMGHEEAPAKLEVLNVHSYIVKAEMTPRQVADHVSKVLAA